MTTLQDADELGETQSWRLADLGWGSGPADLATLSHPANCREYVALHQRLGVGPGVCLLDVRCGSGLALELAAARLATCAGFDASARLLDVAQVHNPHADLRVGDVHTLPWDDATFDVVTSFRGTWGTIPDAIAEIHRVLAPGGRMGITVWGRLDLSPRTCEDLLARTGFVDIERIDLPLVWAFADPGAYARALAFDGPAGEDLRAVEAQPFIQSATDRASEGGHDRRAGGVSIALVGYVARKPAGFN